MLELQTWCKENRLKFKKISDSIVEIYDEKYIYIIGDDPDKLFDKEMNFIFKPEELMDLLNEEISNIIFEFGDRFYYTKFDHTKFYDKFMQDGVHTIPIQFNDLKYIGKAAQDNLTHLPQLGIHSDYESHNGTHQSKVWVSKAKFIGTKVIAICDKNTLGGTLEFQISAADKELRCILGETVVVRYVFDDGRNDEEHEVKLYVINEEGWRNILRINKLINVDNRGSHIDEDDLLRYGKGLVMVFSTESIINTIKDVDQVNKYIKRYRKCFDRVYYQFDSVEYRSADHDFEILERYKWMRDMFWNELPWVLINDSYYVDRESANVKKYLNSIGGKLYPESNDQYLKTYDDVLEKVEPLFEEEDEFESFMDILIRNAEEIAELCTYQIPTGQHKLPKYEAVTINECHYDKKVYRQRRIEFAEQYDVDPDDNESLFFRLIQLGIEEKLMGVVDDLDKYIERVEKEANVIVGAGFIDYFLILWDLIKWAKSDGIMVGIGRGSVGGSLLAYLLDITDIDPMQYDLLFERFLNETRVSGERAKAADALPDIDLDFESHRRDDVKKYLEFKYGNDRICSIGTYNGLKLKSAVTELSKVDGLQFAYLKFITKMIEHQLNYEWSDLFKYAVHKSELREYIQKNHETVNMMKSILNQNLGRSIHASAVILVPKEDEHGNPMTVFDWMPIKWVQKDDQEFLVSEWSGKYIDRAGFLKEDILGLDQLDKFSNILKLVKENHGEEIVLRDIPLEDPKTYKFFKKGWNEDIFQFNSSGLKSFCKKVVPENVEELTAINALWRPGPMGSNAHTDFYEIKHGKKKAVYDYGLKEVTSHTYGLYVYQEQIMRAVNVLGNLTLTESDEVRTVMKKFDKVKMKTYTDKFIQGAIKNGCDAEEAEKIWHKLEKFSGYGFNKSHSAAYAVMAYWAQYLKANYPLEFWTTALQFSKEVADMINLISEMRTVSDIMVKPPNVNKSGFNFVGDPETNSVYWSLLKIKNLAEKGVQKIIDVRTKGGPFKDMNDFLQRMQGSGVGKDKLRYLILSGAFDEVYGVDRERQRKKLIKMYYNTLNEALPEQYDSEAAEEDYFWIIAQKKLTGFGLLNFHDIIYPVDKKMAKMLVSAKAFQKCSAWDEVCVGGQVMELETKRSKKKNAKEFCIVTFQSNNDLIPVVLWSTTWEKYQDELRDSEGGDRVVFITGKVNIDDYRNALTLYSSDDTKIRFF